MPRSPLQTKLERLLFQTAMEEEQGQSPRGSTPRAVDGNNPASPQLRSPSGSASPDAPQVGRRIQIRINTNRSPLKRGSRGLISDEVPQVKFIPGPNSNAPRNYDGLPESLQMAKYVVESKELLAKLVAFEHEGYLARIDFDCPEAPKHTPINFEYEPEEDQEALNSVLHENYCLRLRFQCITEVKRQYRVGVYQSGEEVTMRMYDKYHFKVTFP